MATQIIEFEAPSGLTLDARLYIEGSDTVQYTASSVVESTNRYGVYQATFSNVASNTYQLVASVGTAAVAIWWGFAEDVAQTFVFGVRLSVMDEIVLDSIDCSTVYNVETPAQSCGSDLFAFVEEEKSITLSAFDANGNEVDLSTETLIVTIEDNFKNNKQVIEDAEISKSGNTATFTVNSETNSHPYKGYWSLRRDLDNSVIAYGSYTVRYSATP